MIFRVSWEIDVDAETAQEAAELARRIQLSPYSTATIFSVYPNADLDIPEIIDLGEGETEG